jgi:hypothetical protein
MSKEEEFKRSLHHILDSKEFPFDEAQWEKASQLIDSSRRRKRLAFYFVLPLLLLTVAGTTWLLYPFGEEAINAKGIVHTTTLPSEKHIKENAVDANRSTDKLISHVPSENNLVKTTPPETGNISVPSQQVLHSGDPAANHVNNPVSPDSKTQGQHAFIPEPDAPAKAVKSGEDRQLPTATISGKSKESKNVIGNGNTLPPAAVQTPAYGEQNNPGITGKGENPLVSQLPVATPETSSASSTPSKNEEPSIVSPKEMIRETAIVPTLITSTTSNQQEAQAPAPMPLADTKASVDSALQKATEPTTLSTFPSIMLSAEAGATYLFGWKYPGKTDASGFNPVFGLMLTNFITRKITASVGVQYNSVAHMSYSSQTSKTIRYKLAEESDVTVITPQKIHYISIPLKLAYTINEKNSIGVGYTIAYLLNVDSKVETYHEGITGVSENSTYHTGGYAEGLKTFDSQAALFYRRRLSGKLWLHAEVFYGLSDTKDNGFFKSNVTERNSGLKLTLLYNFFTK